MAYITPPETIGTEFTLASSFTLAIIALNHRLSIPWLHIVTFLYCLSAPPWKYPLQSSVVILQYFWLISSIISLASEGKYSIVNVGNGIALEEAADEVSLAIFLSLIDNLPTNIWISSILLRIC